VKFRQVVTEVASQRVNKRRYAEQSNSDKSLVFLFPIKNCKVQIVQLYTVLKKTRDSVSETLCVSS